VVESGVSDCTVQVTILSSTDLGLCYRSTDDNNNFVFSSGNVYKRVAGSFTSLASFTAILNNDIVSIVLSGSSHTVKVNGTTVATFTETFNQSATKHGLRSHNLATITFENFSIAVP